MLSNLRPLQSKLIFLHSLVFALCSSFYILVFSAKTDLNDFDARFTAMMASYQIRDTTNIFGLRGDFLSGLGNMQQGYLWKFDPVSHMGVRFGTTYNPYFVTVIISILLFICSYAFARKFKTSENVAIFAAYLVPVSTVWSHAHGLVDNQNYALVPQTASLLLFSMLFVMCVESIGIGSLRQNIFWSIVALFVLLYMCAVLTQTLVLTCSLIGSVCFGSYIKLIFDRRFDVILKRTLALIFICIFMWITGVVDYLSGFYRNTAATQNAREPFAPSSLRDFKSFIFDSFFPLSNGRVTQIVSLLLAIFFIHGLFAKKRRDVLYISMASALIFLFAYRLWQRQWLFELGPRHVYLVWFLVPLYATSVAQATITVLSYLSRFLKHPKLLLIKSTVATSLLYVPIIIVVTITLTIGEVRYLGSISRPLIVELDKTEAFLSQQISISPGNKFNGRVVDLMGYTNFEALFQGRIPAINEHSHLVTPLSVDFYQHYLFDPETTPTRSHYKLVNRNTAIYSLLGVKYLRTENLKSPLSDLSDDNSYPPQQFAENDYLIELKNPNLGDYSPTNSFEVGSLAETFEIMDNVDFSLLDDVVVYKPIDPNLVKAESPKITNASGDLIINAKSQGKSVLIIPLEFSNCISFNSNDSKSNLIDSFRVNGILTGLLFEKNLNVTAKLRYGIFTNTGCRLKDLEEYRFLTKH